MNRAIALSLCALLIEAGKASAQYYSERSLEKSFEQNSMFFQPSYINPYGVGTFSNATPGLIDDPFLNLQVSPALFGVDTSGSNHIYLDFRSYRQTATLYQPYYYNPILTTESYLGPPIFPYFYASARPIIEPVFSAAFLTSPLPSTLPGLFIGLMYQGIMQDSKYYTIPYDIYQSYPGYDYNGKSVASSSNIPITTISAGQDNMHHSGNFLTLYAGYRLSPDLSLGVKVGRNVYDEDGTYGNSNYWDNYYYGNGSSMYYNMESRDQSYSHWDLAGGIQYGATPQTSIGVTGGYLWGTATQSLVDRDSSYYSFNSNSSLSFSSGKSNENWNHAGKTYYGGINLTTRLNDEQTITFLYQFNRENADISLGSTVRDTSYYTYN